MNWLRRSICSVLVGLTLMVPFVGTSLANDQMRVNNPRQQTRVYFVYYRTCPDSPWVNYGGFYHVQQAQQAVTYFRNVGYDAFCRAQ